MFSSILCDVTSIDCELFRQCSSLLLVEYVQFLILFLLPTPIAWPNSLAQPLDSRQEGPTSTDIPLGSYRNGPSGAVSAI